ncbi:hypothetical protein GQ600_18116 [Phytophthora cactorum]|nr:hypothetical protein GQ600_18116 [Phytophthora cactorum]
MRSLLLIVFSTLVVLLATTGAVSPNVTNLEPRRRSRDTLPRLKFAHCRLSTTSMTREDCGVTTTAWAWKVNTDDEERASFMAKIVAQAKAYYIGLRVGINPHSRNR